MNRSLVVSKYTLLEILQSKILMGVFGLGVLNFILSFVAKEFTYGVPEKVALDFGFGSLSIAMAGIAVFIGVSLVSQEIENRTLYLVLSKPISRTSFLLGKLMGMLAVFIITALILMGFSLVQYLVMGGQFQSLFIWAFIFQFLEALILLLIIVCLSLVTTRVLSVIIGISVYLVGHSLHSSLELKKVMENEVLSLLLGAASWVVPNFDRLNLKKHLLYQQAISFSDGAWGVAYALGFSLGLFLICNYIFIKKDLN